MYYNGIASAAAAAMANGGKGGDGKGGREADGAGLEVLRAKVERFGKSAGGEPANGKGGGGFFRAGGGGARALTQGALVAALYAALTFVQPFSFGGQQFRISEALTVLPAFTPAAIPGLFAGCLVANTMSFMGLPDMVFGSLATLVAAVLTRAVALRLGGEAGPAPGGGAGPPEGPASGPASSRGAGAPSPGPGAPVARRVLRAALVPLPPVLVNALVIGALLAVVAGLPFGASALGVGVGQAGACYGLGVPLYALLSGLERRKALSF